MNYLKKFEQSRRDYERHLANPTPPPIVRNPTPFVVKNPPPPAAALEVLRVANAIARAVSDVSLNFDAELLRRSIKCEASRQFANITAGRRIAGHHVRGGKWVRR